MADRGEYCRFEFTVIASYIEKLGTRTLLQCAVLKSKRKVSGKLLCHGIAMLGADFCPFCHKYPKDFAEFFK
jgi:hypothetical protein